jgi:hypothetical protein
MELECFAIADRPPDLVPGRRERRWMDHFVHRHPYRCLPLAMANTTGWELLCPMAFTVEWNGGKGVEDLTLRADRPHPDFHNFVSSHFSGGVITFQTGYLFRSPQGWDLYCGGPPNLPKDGVYPLSGIVEADWLPFPFTMNWIMTRPGKVRFEKGEPFCFINLTPHRVMEQVQPVQRSLHSNTGLRDQYEVWMRERANFNSRLEKQDPEAVREAWQRFYFKGEIPPEAPGEAPKDHINKRRLKSVKLGF